MKAIWTLKGMALLAAMALVSAGCGSKEAEESAAAPAPEAAEATEAPAEETASAENQDESTTESIVIQAMDVQETLTATDAAAKNKNWTGATENLLKLQLSGSMKSDADSWQYNRKMTVLQNQLLEAAEAGDPKAKQAIEMLRRSRRVP